MSDETSTVAPLATPPVASPVPDAVTTGQAEPVLAPFPFRAAVAAPGDGLVAGLANMAEQQRADVVHGLQRTVGNRVVARLVEEEKARTLSRTSASILHRATAGPVKRCECGGVAGPDGECAECRERRLSSLTTPDSALARTAAQPHVLQRSTSATAEAPTAPVSEPVADPGAVAAITQAARSGDVRGVVEKLRGRSRAELLALRNAVTPGLGTRLELWLTQKQQLGQNIESAGRAAKWVGLATPLPGAGAAQAASMAARGAAATPEEGLRILWPALPVLDRLEVFDQGWRELERAQIDVILAASKEERDQVDPADPRLVAMLARMDAKEAFEARIALNSEPAARLAATERLLADAPGVFVDEEDAVFDAVLELPPAMRKAFFTKHLGEIYRLLTNQGPTGRFYLMKELATGTEAQALRARLRQATMDRGDDMAAVEAVVERAGDLMKERARIQLLLEDKDLPDDLRAKADARLAEIGELDKLVQFQRDPKTGELEQGSFMGMLADARGDPDALGADAARLGELLPPEEAARQRLETAKQRILMSSGHVETIRTAILQLRAPAPAAKPAAGGDKGAPAPQAAGQAADEALRKQLLDDPAVTKVLDRLTPFERRLVDPAFTAKPFEEVYSRLVGALNGARWGEFFQIVLEISQDANSRAEFLKMPPHATNVQARVTGRRREIMNEILEHQRVPLDALLAFTGNTAVLTTALARVGEVERGQLRLGYRLANDPSTAPTAGKETEALAAFNKFQAELRASQTTLGINFDTAGYHAVLWAVLGSQPTLDEWATPEGRFQAARLWYLEQRGQLELDRGDAQDLTESDEAMMAAAREFAGHFEPMEAAGKIGEADFLRLGALHKRFQTRAGDFSAASDAIGEMAAMVATTVAGAVLIAVTGGAATPGAVALVAAASAGTSLAVREQFGADYYDPNSRDAILAAIDGALAVVGGALAERGAAALLGKGGHELAMAAAKVGGQVAETATAGLKRRVASSVVEGVLDGMLSSVVSEAAGKLMDGDTWRRGLWPGLLAIGQAALGAGFSGAATGGLLGSLMPLGEAMGRGLLNIAAARRIESALNKANAAESLKRAVTAARAGKASEVDRLFATLEGHLLPDDARAIRRHLDAELTDSLGHPAGTATPTDVEARILAETRGVEKDLDQKQLDTELEIVRRSEPRPSVDPAYIDEVDLGNGHVWRRKSDQGWCRFSAYSVCVPPLKGVKAVEKAPAADVKAQESAATPVDTDAPASTDTPSGKKPRKPKADEATVKKPSAESLGAAEARARYAALIALRKENARMRVQIDGLQDGINTDVRRLKTLDALKEDFLEKHPTGKFSQKHQAEMDALDAQVDRATALQDQLKAKINENSAKIDELTGTPGGEAQWQKTEYDQLGGKTDPCFPAGTPVLTPSGPRPIEAISVGDEVLACDPRGDGVPVVARVCAVSRNWTRRLVTIEAGGEVVQATPNHPFWNDGAAAWTAADDLRAGMSLRGSEGTVPVTGVRGLPGAVATHNLEVAGLHTYFVGDRGGLLVHNGEESNWASAVKKDSRIYAVRMKSDPKHVFYIGKTTQGGPEDVMKRFKGHLSKKPGWKKILDDIECVAIKSGNWTAFETAVWEKHFIQMEGGTKRSNPDSPLENDINPITKEEFELYKDGFGHNPCGTL